MKNLKTTIEKSNRKYVKILGVRVDSTSKAKVLRSVGQKITHSLLPTGRQDKFYIVTPNPELVLMVHRMPALKKALNSADFAIPDGIGLSQAVTFLSMHAPKSHFLRFFITFFQGLGVGLATFVKKKWLFSSLKLIKGRELFLDLISLANKKGWRVFLLGGLDDEASLASSKLKIKYQKLKIKTHKGPKLDNNARPVLEVDRRLQFDTIAKINEFKPQLLFVAFGNPKQEIWIHNNLSKLNVGGAMAVGGTFRYVAGLSKLPPAWMEGAGLEWAWRLVTEPSRAIRIFNAWPIFPLKVWQSKLFQRQP